MSYPRFIARRNSPNNPDGPDRVAPERSMAEPLLPADNQPRLDPPHPVDEDQLTWRHRLTRQDWPPFFRSEFNIEGAALVLAKVLCLVQLQLGPIVNLPWIEPYL
jgi:hypothetical protein